MGSFKVIFLLAFLAVSCLNGADSVRSEETAILENILGPNSNYDKRIGPELAEVMATLYLIRINEVSETSMHMTSEFYFRQQWVDSRLAFNSSKVKHFMSTDPDYCNKIWQPDTFIPGSQISIQKAHHTFLKLSPNGTVFKSVMIQANTKCQMDFSKFPHDIQTCSLEFESYGFTAERIRYQWARGMNSVGVDEGILVGDKKVQSLMPETSMVSLTSGNYSRITLDVTFSRSQGYYIRHFYLPAIVIMILTWLTFFIPSSGILRGLVSVSSVVLNVILLEKSNDLTAKVNYSSRLDQYLTTSFVLSALTLVEYLFIVYLQKSTSQKREEAIDKILAESEAESGNVKKLDEPEEKSVGSYLSSSFNYVLTIRQHRRGHEKIDIASRIIFAAIILTYNICYWAAKPN